jgi:hypothetical protein
MKIHPELSLRQPQSLSIARNKGFNKENISQFFDILEKLVDENQVDALRIYNVDESGFTTVQKKSPTVVTLRGKHRAGTVSSGDEESVRLVCVAQVRQVTCVPMIIFKRQRMQPALMIDCPRGSLADCSESVYINSDILVEWLFY